MGSSKETEVQKVKLKFIGKNAKGRSWKPLMVTPCGGRSCFNCTSNHGGRTQMTRVCKIAVWKPCSDADNNLKQTHERTAGRRESEFKRPQQEMLWDRIRLDRQRHLLLLSSLTRNPRATYLVCSCDVAVCQRRSRHMFKPRRRTSPKSGQDDSRFLPYS